MDPGGTSDLYTIVMTLPCHLKNNLELTSSKYRVNIALSWGSTNYILYFLLCFQCREATLKLFRSERSLKKKQVLDELTKRGLTDDVKVVTAILKVQHIAACTYK